MSSQLAWQGNLDPLTAPLITGGTLAITGTYLLVTFAPHTSTHITAHLVQYYTVSWHFLLYLVSEFVFFFYMMPGKHFPPQHTTLPWSRGLVSPAQSLHISVSHHIRANKAGCVLLLIISSQLSALSRGRVTGGRLLWVNYGVKVLLIPCQRVDK